MAAGAANLPARKDRSALITNSPHHDSLIGHLAANVLADLPIEITLHPPIGRQSYHLDTELRLWKEVGRVAWEPARALRALRA